VALWLGLVCQWLTPHGTIATGPPVSPPELPCLPDRLLPPPGPAAVAVEPLPSLKRAWHRTPLLPSTRHCEPDPPSPLHFFFTKPSAEHPLQATSRRHCPAFPAYQSSHKRLTPHLTSPHQHPVQAGRRTTVSPTKFRTPTTTIAASKVSSTVQSV
jgi:hypothetical protein